MTPKPEIPGTYVFGIEDCRRGFALNALCASLATPRNRMRFLADEAAYCDEFGLSADQRAALLDRDWKAMLDAGGSIFYVCKLAMVDGRSMQYLGGVFTHMTTEDFISALEAGGRRLG
ncbi:protocatechuate 3,4-dioxygenase [Lentzea sp. NPDC059081]|uniref:protocatechuate 3,4-dioxygenase n=1 Tax=Lentzea sp. NPDC059081 TaxID=3346719 RepID=UPI003681953B